MSITSEIDAIGPLLNRLLDNLARAASSQTSKSTSAYRQQIEYVRSFYPKIMRANTLADELLACFTEGVSVNIKLADLDFILQALFVETPQTDYQTALVQSVILFTLSAEAMLVKDIEFKSRDNVEAMMTKMKASFDTAREQAADAIDSACYQSLTYLAGALTNHLSTTARPLPRVIAFSLPLPLPALTLSQRIYYEADRSDEVIDENHIVHPAFCPREIRGLAS